MIEATTYTLIDGRKVSGDIKTEIAQRVAERRVLGKKIPHLAIILVGDDGASQTYVDNKVKSCKEVGFHYTMMRFADTISEEKLRALDGDALVKLNRSGFLQGAFLVLASLNNMKKLIDMKHRRRSPTVAAAS